MTIWNVAAQYIEFQGNGQMDHIIQFRQTKVTFKYVIKFKCFLGFTRNLKQNGRWLVCRIK